MTLFKRIHIGTLLLVPWSGQGHSIGDVPCHCRLARYPASGPSVAVPSSYDKNKDTDESSSDISGIIVCLGIPSKKILAQSLFMELTLAQALHQLPANPPPSSASAAARHERHWSPINPTISIMEMLHGAIHSIHGTDIHPGTDHDHARVCNQDAQECQDDA